MRSPPAPPKLVPKTPPYVAHSITLPQPLAAKISILATSCNCSRSKMMADLCEDGMKYRKENGDQDVLGVM